MRSTSSELGAPDKDHAPETGPYVLRTLLADLPLSAEGDGDNVQITCVEFLDQNLYVGTSSSVLLHFVQIPPDVNDPVGSPSYILASRLPPTFHEPQALPRPGIQQILLLPKVSKACILCNWTATFYSLPELSPVFGTTQIRPCSWIGGTDLNTDLKENPQDGKAPSVIVLASLRKKIRVIKISELPRGLKTIDFAGSLRSVRRDSYACVANAKSYALLDVDRLLKIPLFPISSLKDSQSTIAGDPGEDISFNTISGIKRCTSAQAEFSGRFIDREHSRSASLGTFTAEPQEIVSLDSSPAPVSTHLRSYQTQGLIPETPLPPPRTAITEQEVVAQAPPAIQELLKPHILSPTPQEFLLVTGTSKNDPGVGMFVNLEGDPTRSTLEFDQYPDDIVVDGRGVGIDPKPTTIDEEEEGFVLASMNRNNDHGKSSGIEIQRWDLDPGDTDAEKHWLNVPVDSKRSDESSMIGLRSVLDSGNIYFAEATHKMMLKLFRPVYSGLITSKSNNLVCNEDEATAISQEGGNYLLEGYESKRGQEERQFAKRLASARTRIVVWSGKTIWWAVRNPLVLRLDASIPDLTTKNIQNDPTQSSLGRKKLVEIVNSLRGREAKTEAEYLSLGYIRQRAGLSLFLDGFHAMADPLSESEFHTAEDALVEGSLDPRVILAIIPYLRNDIFEGKNGIWIHGGIEEIAHNFIASSISCDSHSSAEVLESDQTLYFLRRYLTAWRKKKGFGSVANENEIFRSVDAALLAVLLRLDRIIDPVPSEAKSVRADLYELVDRGVDCFERAITLLELHGRLYVLSRLYQSRKMVDKVLATWRRILEDDLDERGEFMDGNKRFQEYLLKIRNLSLIQEYGVWLAARCPKLGVQVFAEDRIQGELGTSQIVRILRDGAPGAVKDYLEYLVFHKHHSEYVDELILHYLDIVTHKLEESAETRLILAQSYESYRSLRPPKPTYRQFLAENVVDEEWWLSRLRLLQLLGGSPDLKPNYDVEFVLLRIAPYTQDLVPEIIILDGRQAHHDKALNRLTHGLGDYDTAINYCLLGGSSIYHPRSGAMSRDHISTHEEQETLFGLLLSEFLQIDDVSNRIEQTCNLLDRFGDWFDVQHVLNLIPDTWSVDLVSSFLLSSLRRIMKERGETMVTKALRGAENLKVNAELNENIIAAGR